MHASKNLNKAVKRLHHPMTTAMEVIAKMPGAIPYVKALSHQSNVLTAFPQRPKILQIAEVRAVKSLFHRIERHAALIMLNKYNAAAWR